MVASDVNGDVRGLGADKPCRVRGLLDENAGQCRLLAEHTFHESGHPAAEARPLLRGKCGTEGRDYE